MLEQGRRRTRLELLLRQGAWAVAASLLGFCLLLLAGTQVLDWRWPVALAFGAVTWAVWAVVRSTPPRRKVALRLDGALETGDLFSTALHYREGAPVREPDPRFLERLNTAAEQTAASTDVSSAIPMRWPRSGWAAVASFVLAFSLFLLRYGILHTFDLTAPLAAVEFDTLTGAPVAKRKAPPRQMAKADMPGVEKLEIPAEDQSTWTQEQLAEKQMETLKSPDANQPAREGLKDADTGQEAADSEGEDSGDDGTKGSDDPNAPAGAADPRKGGEKSGSKDRGDEKSSSLMDKMRDALANLMDKMKIDSKGGETKSASNKGQKGEQGQKMEKGQKARGQQQQGQDADASQQGDQPGEGDSPQQAKSQQGGDQDAPSKNEKSGVGKQDGNKDTELAEQRDAMGKLSEVLGKRALNVQGEVMVEVNNSRNQQLKTPYVDRSARHADSGGEVSRDEVPLELRDYVQRYYESVRRAGTSKK